MMYQLSMHSPVGDLTLTEADGQIIALDWGWAPDEFGLVRETPLLVTARNTIPIIIPCHRVVAAGGKLGGYSGDGGVETKKQLLNIEALL